MALAPIFMAVVIGGIGITCVAWPLRAVKFCRWYHLKKPKWVQDAVCRYGHAAMDAHILSDHGSMLLFVCAGADMDRNYQGILKLTDYQSGGLA